MTLGVVRLCRRTSWFPENRNILGLLGEAFRHRLANSSQSPIGMHFVVFFGSAQSPYGDPGIVDR